MSTLRGSIKELPGLFWKCALEIQRPQMAYAKNAREAYAQASLRTGEPETCSVVIEQDLDDEDSPQLSSKSAARAPPNAPQHFRKKKTNPCQ